VVPDTGSSDLWVPALNCSACNPQVARYDIHQSCTSKMIGDEITFRYGDGTVAVGHSLFDSVNVGNVQVNSQFLIQVDRMESATHMKSDGILGLAHHYTADAAAAQSGVEKQTFIATLFNEHPEIPKQFAFYLTGNTQQRSKLIIGDPDIWRYSKEGEFHYGKGYYMQHTSLWLTSVWSIGWSNTGVEVAFTDRGTTGAPALIDSGSSLIVLAPNIFDHLMAELKWRFTNCRELPQQSIMSCDCPPANDLSRVPSLVVNFIDEQDLQFSLCMSPDEYILESVDPLNGVSSCVPALQRGSEQQPVPMIFGMTFLRSFYTVFDVANRRIGFARNNLSPLPAGAKCNIEGQPILRRAIWLTSVIWAVFSVLFACYVMFMPKWLCSFGSAQVDPRPASTTVATEGNQ